MHHRASNRILTITMVNNINNVEQGQVAQASGMSGSGKAQANTTTPVEQNVAQKWYQ
jgi:hypothetical protein